ncbi:hypothetical protein [Streptomyces sp. NPDC048252]|uniref:aromatic-ring hydroxylase C-terminal domain-containing protein n=1 Tax=Streptomyces sp. NPDC048252 TaxID=3154612 RepID=UPI0034193EE4
MQGVIRDLIGTRDGTTYVFDKVSGSSNLHGPATGRESRIRYAVGPARNDLGCGAVLVRPDGTVAWAGDRAPDREAFTRAAGRSFSGPAV